MKGTMSKAATNAARAFKQKAKLEAIKRGTNLGGLAKDVINNAKDRDRVTAMAGKAKLDARGAGAIKQAGKTIRSVARTHYSTEKKKAKYEAETEQKKAQYRANTAAAALQKWNGIITQQGMDSIFQSSPSSENQGQQATETTGSTTSNPTINFGGH